MMPEEFDPRTRASEALVVFTGQTDLKWLHCLKPGFRHCFVIIGEGVDWVLVNPLSHQTDLAQFHGVSSRDFHSAFVDVGCRVVACRILRAPHKSVPWRFFTCVEAVKRLLGLHEPWIATPWQLYRFLKKSIKTEKTLDI